MFIRQLSIQHFRGFDNAVIKPKRHVVLMGEPGAGRSDIINSIAMVLSPDIIRAGTTTELDFYRRDTGVPIEISITIGGLSPDLEQHFLDNLEVWDIQAGQLLKRLESPEDVTGQNQEWVLRLAYRGQWLADQERCEELVYYPKHSDPASQSFRRASLVDIQQLGFALLHNDSRRILDLGAHGTFRRIVEQTSGSDFTAALTNYVKEVGDAAEHFTTSNQLKTALGEVVKSMREVLRIKEDDASKLIGFSPEGGSPSGLLRSLGPTIDLGGGTGALPAWRQGSTVGALFRLAESLAFSSGSRNIIAIDDLGDGLNPASATHFGALIRNIAGQAWITTRLPSVAEIFEPNEVIRLSSSLDGTRQVHQGSTPTTKAEAIVAKHWHRNLLPVFNHHSVIVVEGPHDLAAIHAMEIRLCNEEGSCLPAAHNIAIISAGATGGGGYTSVLRLTAAAKKLGFCAVGIVDGDIRQEVKTYVADHVGDANAVVRLPDRAAIEYVIVHNVPAASICEALVDACNALGLQAIPGLDKMAVNVLESRAIEFIKKNEIHAAFIEALPFKVLPALVKTLLEKAVLAAREQLIGVVQL